MEVARTAAGVVLLLGAQRVDRRPNEGLYILKQNDAYVVSAATVWLKLPASRVGQRVRR